MTRSEIEQRVLTFLRNNLEINESLLLPTNELKRDIGMSSLDAMELSIFIKRTFGFQPERKDVHSLVTLADVYAYIEAHQS